MATFGDIETVCACGTLLQPEHGFCYRCRRKNPIKVTQREGRFVIEVDEDVMSPTSIVAKPDKENLPAPIPEKLNELVSAGKIDLVDIADTLDSGYHPWASRELTEQADMHEAQAKRGNGVAVTSITIGTSVGAGLITGAAVAAGGPAGALTVPLIALIGSGFGTIVAGVFGFFRASGSAVDNELSAKRKRRVAEVLHG